MSFSTSAIIRVLLIAGSFATWSGLAGADERPREAAKKAPETAHALRELIAEADQMLARFDDEIADYSCLLIKRERNDDRLSAYQYLWMKVRERRNGENSAAVPFAVYIKFLKPESVAGREVLYVEGKRNGDMLVRKGGVITPYVTLRIDPEGSQAKRASHHRVTQSGLRYMLEELKARMEKEIEHDICEVLEYEDAKFNGRPCRHLVVQHRERHPKLDFQSARVFIDEELGLPVYFAAYDWSQEDGEESPLLEEFLFTRITLNPGFTEKDFQEENRQYGFRLDE